MDNYYFIDILQLLAIFIIVIYSYYYQKEMQSENDYFHRCIWEQDQKIKKMKASIDRMHTEIETVIKPVLRKK